MAEDSWPSADHASGAVVDLDYEKLALGYSGSGVVGAPSDGPVVFADDTGLHVKINPGRYAMVRGMLWFSGTTVVTLPGLDPNPASQDRIDLVVARYDRTTGNVRCKVLTGTPGGPAPTPVQNTGLSGFYDLPLATIKVTPSDTSIGASQVTTAHWYLAPLSIVCTSTTRPPATAGLRIFETDTGREYVGNGTAFITSISDSGWIACDNTTNWDLGSCVVRKRSGQVTFLGQFIRRNASIGPHVQVRMGSVPGGYHPDRVIPIHAYADGGQIVYCYVNPAGEVWAGFYYQSIDPGETVTMTVATWPAP
jgi:hypothetical protein